MLHKVYRVGRGILLDHSMRGEKMNSFFHEAVEENPIIAAVKNMDDLKICEKYRRYRKMLCNRRDTGDFYIIWRCLFDP